jgi:hypothetical protein
MVACAREVERTGDPFNRNVLGESAEVGEIEEIAEVEQLLLNGHKKIRYQRAGIGFSRKPALDSNA